MSPEMCLANGAAGNSRECLVDIGDQHQKNRWERRTQHHFRSPGPWKVTQDLRAGGMGRVSGL